jgi:hypothetical protein
MKWYWVLLLCSLSASLGLLFGCMCRVAGEADNRNEKADDIVS